MHPISQNNPNLYKGPSSSVEFNKLRNDMHYDLVQLYNVANRHDEEIRTNMDVLVRENFFLQNKVVELENLLDKIQTDLMYKSQGLKKQRLIKSFYSLEGLSDSKGPEALVNPMYGYLSIPYKESSSKLSYIASDDAVVIPDSLEVRAMESNDVEPLASTGNYNYYTVEDKNIYRAFDKDRNTFWVHTSSFPEDSRVNEVYGILHIKLPLDAINNIYANTLTINPFPEYSMTIRDIQYKGFNEQWYRLPNYPTTKYSGNIESPVEIQNAGKLFFSFPRTEITEIQILFTQPYWFANQGKRDFVYGFQEIEVDYRIIGGGTAEIVSEFSLEGSTKRFSVIQKPTVIPLMGSTKEINDLVEHKLYYNKDLTNEFSFGNEIMAPIQKVYVKTTLKSHNDVAPMIRQINLDYTYKELDEL